MNPTRLCLVVLALVMVPAKPVVAQNTIRIRLVNRYVVSLNLGIGTANRAGADTVEGTLTRQTDGTWEGEVQARIGMTQDMKGLGKLCPLTKFSGSQQLKVLARSTSGFNPRSQTITYRSGTANGGYLFLEVRPAAAPNINPTGPCLDMYEDDRSPFPLLPLNDARWTQPTSGYVIGLPQSGLLEYEDVTLAALPNNPQPTGGLVPASSSWTIRIDRP